MVKKRKRLGFLAKMNRKHHLIIAAIILIVAFVIAFLMSPITANIILVNV